MLKFKKNGIFSRSASEEATASELQEGGVVAVWGSPGSGKTTMAVKIAKYLADKKRPALHHREDRCTRFRP